MPSTTEYSVWVRRWTKFMAGIVSTGRAAADGGATRTPGSRFEDGPARGTVLITTVGLHDASGTGVTPAS
jgi:hypothetical protein